MKTKTNEEITKLKDMSGRDRLWYIWEYYKIPIIAVAFLLFFLATFLPALIGGKETILTIYSINTPIYEDGSSTIQMGFLEYGTFDKNKQEIELDGAIMIDTENPMALGSEYVMKITAVITARGLDAMLTDESAMVYYTGLSAFRDLSQFLSEEMLEELSERLQYYEDEDGISRPYMVDVSDSLALTQAGVSNDKIYYGMVINSSNEENALTFLEYLLDY